MAERTALPCKRLVIVGVSKPVEEVDMAVGRALGQRMLSLVAAVWFAIGAIAHDETWAVPYDPYVQGGGRSGPWISDRLPTSVRRKIESAIELIERRIDERPACSSLFAELGRDGVKVIRRTLYYPANALMEQKVCWRAYAFTKVGIRPTWICRKMWVLPVWRVALVLLHEALHHAGLEEWPHSQAALDSRSITGRVTTACGF